MEGRERVGPYLLLGQIGAGGMGRVYLGRHAQTGQEVALKVLHGHERIGERQERRFLREIKALASIQHPGLVRFLASGEERGVPWLAMERVEGETLETRLRERGPLSWEETRELGLQLCAAVGRAHAAGVLHRDLKPDNVLCGPNGRFVVTDFGLAKQLSQEESTRLSQTGALQGTPGFWAPEQASGQGHEAGPAADVYGVGAVLYAALTGRPPVMGQTLVEIMIATRDALPPRPSALGVAAGPLEEPIMRCLAKAPQDRPADLEALSLALAGAAASTPPRRGRWVALVALAALLCAGAWVALRDERSQATLPPAPPASSRATSPAPSSPAPSSPLPLTSPQPRAPAPSAPAHAFQPGTDWAGEHSRLAADFSPESFERRVALLQGELDDPGRDGRAWTSRYLEALRLFETRAEARDTSEVQRVGVRLVAVYSPYASEILSAETLEPWVERARALAQGDSPAAREIAAVSPWLEYRLAQLTGRRAGVLGLAFERAAKLGAVSPFWRAAGGGTDLRGPEAFAEFDRLAESPDEVAWARVIRMGYYVPERDPPETVRPLFDAALRRAESPGLKARIATLAGAWFLRAGEADSALLFLSRVSPDALLALDRSSFDANRVRALCRMGNGPEAWRHHQALVATDRLGIPRDRYLEVEVAAASGRIDLARSLFARLPQGSNWPMVRLSVLLGRVDFVRRRLASFGEGQLPQRVALADLLLRVCRVAGWRALAELYAPVLEEQRRFLLPRGGLLTRRYFEQGLWRRGLRLACWLYADGPANERTILAAESFEVARKLGASFPDYGRFAEAIYRICQVPEVDQRVLANLSFQLLSWRGDPLEPRQLTTLGQLIDASLPLLGGSPLGRRAQLEIAAWSLEQRQSWGVPRVDQILLEWRREDPTSEAFLLELARWRPKLEAPWAAAPRLESGGDRTRVALASLALRPSIPGPRLAPEQVNRVLALGNLDVALRRGHLLQLTRRSLEAGSPDDLLRASATFELARDWTPAPKGDLRFEITETELQLARGQAASALATTRAALEHAKEREAAWEAELLALQARALRVLGRADEIPPLETRALGLARTSQVCAQLARAAQAGASAQRRHYAWALSFPLRPDRREALLSEALAAGHAPRALWEDCRPLLYTRAEYLTAVWLADRVAEATRPGDPEGSAELAARVALHAFRMGLGTSSRAPEFETLGPRVQLVSARSRHLYQAQLSLLEARAKGLGPTALSTAMRKLEEASRPLSPKDQDAYWVSWDLAEASRALAVLLPERAEELRARSRRLLGEWAARGAPSAVGLRLALLHLPREEWAATEDASARALREAMAVGLRGRVALIQRIRSRALYALGRYPETISACLAASGGLGSPGDESNNQARLALAYDRVGEGSAATAAAYQAVRWGSLANPDRRVHAMFLLGYLQEGTQSQRALESLEKACAHLPAGEASQVLEVFRLAGRGLGRLRAGDRDGLAELLRARALVPRMPGFIEACAKALVDLRDREGLSALSKELRREKPSPHELRVLAEAERALR